VSPGCEREPQVIVGDGRAPDRCLGSIVHRWTSPEGFNLDQRTEATRVPAGVRADELILLWRSAQDYTASVWQG
jgi:hypothetical protein